MTDTKEPTSAVTPNYLVSDTDTMLHQRRQTPNTKQDLLYIALHLEEIQAQAKPIYLQPQKLE